jgi:hypothetical protein
MHLKLTILLSSLLLFVFVNFSQSDVEIKEPKYVVASIAFGFLSAQKNHLTYIENQFPSLQLDVIKARISFDVAFGKAEEEISEYLEEVMGTSNFKIFKDTSLMLNLATNQSEIITPEIAKEFLWLVEKRAGGNIPSPILETLCAFNFKDFPEHEFIFGFTSRFNTKDHPKAKNTHWSISVPISWSKEEGSSPNVINKFTSDLGYGEELVLLMVRDLPNAKNLSKAEIESIYTESNFRMTMPKGATFISFSKSTFDSIPGGIVEMEEVLGSLDSQRKMRILQYSFIHKNKTHVIQCSVSSKNITEDLSVKMARFKPIFKKIANSVVVNEQ